MVVFSALGVGFAGDVLVELVAAVDVLWFVDESVAFEVVEGSFDPVGDVVVYCFDYLVGEPFWLVDAYFSAVP